jgi:hypothetical protein
MQIAGKVKKLKGISRANAGLGALFIVAGLVAGFTTMSEGGEGAFLGLLLGILVAGLGIATFIVGRRLFKECAEVQDCFNEETLKTQYNNDIDFYFSSHFKGLQRANIIFLCFWSVCIVALTLVLAIFA